MLKSLHKIRAFAGLNKIKTVGISDSNLQRFASDSNLLAAIDQAVHNFVAEPNLSFVDHWAWSTQSYLPRFIEGF